MKLVSFGASLASFVGGSGWSTTEDRKDAPAGVALRTAALSRIRQMNGAGGGLALASSEDASGAVSLDECASALSLNSTSEG